MATRLAQNKRQEAKERSRIFRGEACRYQLAVYSLAYVPLSVPSWAMCVIKNPSLVHKMQSRHLGKLLET